MSRFDDCWPDLRSVLLDIARLPERELDPPEPREIEPERDPEDADWYRENA